MTDITKCTNTDCLLMKKCYRHRAASFKVWQSYSHFRPDWETGKCEHFLPLFKVVSKGTWNDGQS